jgi:hypothetical protein
LFTADVAQVLSLVVFTGRVDGGGDDVENRAQREVIIEEVA